MKRTNRRIISVVMSLVMLLSLVPVLSAPALAQEAATGGIKILKDSEGADIDYSPTLVWGRSGSVIIKLENKSGDVRYNIGVELGLPTGVSYVSGTSGAQGTVLLKDPVEEDNTISFHDQFDMANNETVHIEIPLIADESAGLGEGTLDISVSSFASAYAETGGLLDKGTITLNVAPVLVEVLDDDHEKDDYYDSDFSLGKQLKGAGATEKFGTAEDKDGEYYHPQGDYPNAGNYDGEDNYDYENEITIINNDYAATTVNLTHVVPNGVQVTSIAIDGGTHDGDIAVYNEDGDYNRTYNWSIIVAKGATCTVTYANNIFDMYTTERLETGEGVFSGGVNSGARIKHGKKLYYDTSYTATGALITANGGYSGTALTQDVTAMDIIIGKTGTLEAEEHGTRPFKAGETITYTLEVRTAQYHEVQGIVVVDEFGDGLAYNSYGEIKYDGFKPEGSNAIEVNQENNVVTISKAGNSGFEMPAGATAEFPLTAVICSTWALAPNNGKPVSAKDTLENEASLTATVAPAYPDGDDDELAYAAPDSDDAEIEAPGPAVSKAMVSINDSPAVPIEQLTDDFYHLSVDDEFTVRYTYDASDVHVPQQNVVLTDFYPLSTELVTTENVTFTVNGTAQSLSLSAAGDHIYTNTPALSTLNPTSVTFGDGTVSGKTSFKATFDSLPAETVIKVEYTLRVRDTKDVTDAKKDYSMAKLSYTNTPGAAFSDREQFPICFDAPDLDFTHEVKTGENEGEPTYGISLPGVISNDEQTFKVTVTNNGGAAAYDVMVTVEPPSELTSLAVSNSDENIEAFTESAGKYTSKIKSIPAGESVVITYTATTIASLGGGRVMPVPATLTYQKSSAAHAETYTLYGEDGTKPLTRPVTLTAAEPTIEKTKFAQENSTLSVGDWVAYKIDVTVPSDINIYDATLTDTLPTGQTLMGFYTVFNADTGVGSGEILPIGQATPHIVNITPTTGQTTSYYVKAEVLSGGGTSQNNEATLTWYDLVSGGTSHTKTANIGVTVNKPNLTGRWEPPSRSITGDGNAILMTYIIKNTGDSPAYNFAPLITVPDTLAASEFAVNSAGVSTPTHTTTEDTNIYTFDEVQSLGVNDEYTITFKVKRNETYTPGATVIINGKADADEYWTKENNKGQKLAPPSTDTTLTFPSTVLSKTATGSSYVTDDYPAGKTDNIRPYDTLTYRVTYKIPKGTKLTSLTLTEAIPEGFTLQGYSNISSNLTRAGESLTVTANEGTMDAGDGDKVFTYDVTVRANKDANSDGDPQAGRSYDFTTTASPDGAAETAKVSIGIVEPSLTATLGTTGDKTFFDNADDTITVNAKLTNAGNDLSAAELVTAAITFPAGMEVKTTPSGAEVVNPNGTASGSVTWTNLTVADAETLSFTLTKTGDNSTASFGDVVLTVDYYSTDNISSRGYGPVTAEAELVPTKLSISLADKLNQTYSGDPILIGDVTRPEDSKGTVTYTYYTAEGCTETDKTTADDGATTSGGAPKNVGTYYVIATVAADGNYTQATSNAARLTITQATPTLTIEGETLTYNAKAEGIDTAKTEYTGDGAVTYAYYTNAGCTQPTDTAVSGAATPGGAPKNAGTYYVKATSAETRNYAGKTSESVELIINPAVPEITLEDHGDFYKDEPITNENAVTKGVTDGTAVTGTVTYVYYTAAGCTETDKTTADDGAATPGGAPKNAGTYYVKATVAADGNYTTNSVTAKLTIAPAGVVILLETKEAYYTGKPIPIGEAVTVSDGAVTYVYYTDNGGQSGSILDGPPTNAGVYHVTATVAAHGNYKEGSADAVLTIKAVAPTISMKGKTVVYSGNCVSVDEAGVEGASGGTEVTGAVTYTYYTAAGCTENDKTTTDDGADKPGDPPANAGTYYVTATVAAEGNYETETSEPVKLVIEEASTHVTLENKRAKHTGSAISIGEAVTVSNGGKTYTYYTNADCTEKTDNDGAAPTAVGTYYVKVKVAPDGNYRACETTAMLVIYDDETAHDTYSVTGTITRLTNETGGSEKVAKALVQLMNADNAVLASTETKTDGTYAFSNVDPGQYKLRVSHDAQAMTLFAAVVDKNVERNGEFPHVSDDTIQGGKDAEVGGDAVGDTEKPDVRTDLLKHKDDADGQFVPETDGKKGFTQEELDKIGQGLDGFLLLELTADDVTKTLDNAKKEAIRAASGKVVGYVVDLNVYKYVWPSRSQPDAYSVTQLIELPQIVKVTVNIPQHLRGQSGLALYRVHQGQVKELPTAKEYVPNEECVVFGPGNAYMDIYIREFSLYALVHNAIFDDDSRPAPSQTPTNTPACTLTYINGGSVVSRVDCTPGKDYAALSGEGLAVGEGLSFQGWSLTENGPVAFAPGDTIRPGASATLYAVLVDSSLPQLNRTEHFAYIVGCEDGKVHPERNISRQEVATILMRLLTDESRAEYWSTENSFPDVAPERWSNNAISTMEKAGIFKGMDDGSFRPEEYITRAQFAAMISRFDNRKLSGGADFNDIAGHWAEESIRRAAALGWVQGYEDGSFRPDENITRAEAMTMVNRVLGRAVTPESLMEGMITWPDNTDSRVWYYSAVQEATNSHRAVRNERGREIWTQILPVRDWAALEKQWSTAQDA